MHRVYQRLQEEANLAVKAMGAYVRIRCAVHTTVALGDLDGRLRSGGIMVHAFARNTRQVALLHCSLHQSSYICRCSVCNCVLLTVLSLYDYISDKYCLTVVMHNCV